MRIGVRLISAAVTAMLLLAPVVVTRSASATTRYQGELDSAFNGKGWTATALGTGKSFATDVALEPNGSIVVVGTTGIGSAATQVALARYLPTGKLDPSFGTHGVVITTVGLHNSEAAAVAVQPNGKIVVVGSTNNQQDILVLRYNLNGTLDTSFNGGGATEFGIGATINEGTSAVLQPNGKIVVGGDFFNGLNDDMAVVRFNANGSLDTSFNGSGFNTTTAELGSYLDYARAVALQPDGKIVLAGFTTYANRDTTLVRFNSNGSLDTGFGTGGIRDDDFGGGDDEALKVAVSPNGQIVVGGYATAGGFNDFNVATYSAQGAVTRDAMPYGTDLSDGNGLALQRNGAIVAVPGPGLAPIRLHPDLSPDAEFGSNLDGVGDELDSKTDAGVEAAVLQKDAKIVAVGSIEVNGTFGFLVARWLGDTIPPTHALVSGLPSFSLASTLRPTWSAVDAGSGVTSYDVQSRSAPHGSSTYTAWSATSTQTPKTTLSIKAVPGTTQCIRIRARDAAGNLSGFSAPRCAATALGERALMSTGTWTKLAGPSYYLGLAMSSSVAGSALLTTTHFRRLAVIATTCPGCGSLRIFLGSKLLDTVSLAAPMVHHRQVIQIYASSSTLSGIVKLVQNSSKKAVTIEGVAFNLG